MTIDWDFIGNLDQIDADNAEDLYDQLDQVVKCAVFQNDLRFSPTKTLSLLFVRLMLIRSLKWTDSRNCLPLPNA